MCARIAYVNYTKKLRIFNILNFFCVVYIAIECFQNIKHEQPASISRFDQK